MSNPEIEDQSLRERIVHADQLVRELGEHLKQSFLPRLQRVADLVQSYQNSAERDEIADSTVRNAVAVLLKSDDFSQSLIDKLDPYLSSIQKGVEKVLQGS
ncbi:MAG: hypothetical protein EHM42_00475 [Planctomycetaceae bacterium]|nr:MAG: hypothetical protein EHM42_00475 [Planctomycetaceae bacterium]